MSKLKKAITAILIIASLAVIPFSSVNAASYGPFFASTATDAGGGDKTWSNLSNISANDGANVSAWAIGSNDYSNYLNVTGFAFSIPASASITGIEVTIGRYGSQAGSIQDSHIYVMQSGSSAGSDDLADTTGTWPASETPVTYGGASNLWGRTNWTPSLINASDFGVSIQATNIGTGNRSASVDYITVTIYFNNYPTLTVTNSPVIYTGMQQFATVSGSVAGTVSDIKYNGSATAPTNAGTYAVTADFIPDDTANYDSLFDAPAGGFVISPLEITVTAESKSKTYGDPEPLLTYTYAPSLIGSDTFTGDIERVAGETVAGSPYAISQGSLSLGANYTLTFVGADLTITTRPLEVIADTQSKIYGDAFTFLGTEFTSDDLLLSDSISSVTLTSDGAPANATVSGSPYAIVASSATGTGLDNYDISYTDGSFTVNPKALTITAADQSKTYGDAFTFLGTELTTDGLVNTDTVTNVTLTSDGAPTTATVSGSPYAIGASSATGTGLDNYDISYSDGSFTVAPKILTITADDQSKTYGDTFTFLGTEYTPDGLVNTDTISGVTLTSDGAPAVATVAGSPYAIVASAALGTGLENYDITYIDGYFTLGLKTLTITAADQSKTYGDAFTFLGTEFTPVGLVNSDTVISVTLASDGALATVTVSGSPFAIIASAATGTGLDNYDIVNIDGRFTVSHKTLTVTATDQNKTYGDAFTFLGTEFTSDGLVNTDTVTNVTLTSDGAPASATVSGSPYAIVASSATGTGLDNYDLAYVDGNLSVGLREVTIIPDDLHKTYGDTFTFLGTEFTAPGLVTINGDTITYLELSSDGVNAISNVGSHDILSDNAVGTGLNNYTLIFGIGHLFVDPKELTITASDQFKTYGDEFIFTGTEYTPDGLVNFDSVTSANLTSDGSPAAASVSGSPYAIVVREAVGTGLENYDIVYVDGEFTVAERPITITADALSKTYGDADPTLTYAITAGSLAFSDDFTGTLERVTGETVAGSPYAISQGSLSLGTNYTLTFVGADLSITKRAITVTADAMSKLIGTADPTFTYSITAGSLGFSDAFTGALDRDPGETAGTYAITIGSLALTEDYEITFVGDLLTIYPYRFFLPAIIRP